MTIFAIAISSNLDKHHNILLATQYLNSLGFCQFSRIYEIPCRDKVGADYWNSACLLHADLNHIELTIQLKQLEQCSGRIRPSHSISLDIDLIAWGEDLLHMQFNPKKLPMAQDVIIPLAELWEHDLIKPCLHQYQTVSINPL